MNLSEPRAWIFLDKQEFKLFKEEIFIPEIEDELAKCKSDPDGDYGLYLTVDQLDEAHMQAGCLLDEAPTKKQRELWDGIEMQLGNALDEATMGDDEVLSDEDEEDNEEDNDEEFDEDCGDSCG